MPSWKSVVSLLALTALLPLFLNTDGADAGHEAWSPTYSASVANTTPGATSDIHLEFGVESGKYNLGGVILFTPKEYAVPVAADLPLGAKIATLNSQPYLGLLNGPCSPFIPVGFEFINASVDTANTIAPKAPGETDALQPLAADTDGNGIQDGADKYPVYLNDVFEGAQPRARLFGSTFIQSASTTVILNFVIFEPGTSPNATFLPALDPSLGYPAVAVLQNPLAPVSPPGTITDFCSPLTTQSDVFGLSQDNPNTGADESGKVVRQNPAADGTYNLVIWARSQRDADHDGLENGFDTCAYAPNQEDPRKSPQQGGDPDLDAIDSACDPDPAGKCGPNIPQGTSPLGIDAGKDCDADTFYNRADNCPLVPNADQADLDRDSIGDACDQNPPSSSSPATADGEFREVCIATPIAIGAGGPALDVNTVPPCGGTTVVVNPGETGGGGGPTSNTGGTGTTGGQRAGGGVGGPSSGIGSLSPVAATVPAWALIASALGGTGLIGSLGVLASRIFRRRQL